MNGVRDLASLRRWRQLTRDAALAILLLAAFFTLAEIDRRILGDDDDALRAAGTPANSSSPAVRQATERMGSAS
ncbi:MAG: hypothetical protein AAGC56_10015 [Pseudomonadota bacterium]